jgi:hypothetical protein
MTASREPSLAVEVTCTEHGPMTRVRGGWVCGKTGCDRPAVDDTFLATLGPHAGFVPAPPGVTISVTLVRAP